MDEHREVASLGPRLTRRIVANHRYSQWANLRRVWSDLGEAVADENFTAFIGGRGLLLNFLELRSLIHPLVEAELALKLSAAPEVTAIEYSIELSAHQRIAKKVSRLKTESIETIDDRAWAICQLTPTQQRVALQSAIELFDAATSRVQGRPPGSSSREVEISFAALHTQLALANSGVPHPESHHLRPGARLSADWLKSNFPMASGGPVLDLLRFGLRNERWAERIDEHATAGRPGLMYVLGAGHFLDFEHFDGLLTLLRKRGFQVSLVR